MAFNATYTEGDIAPVAIDAIVKVLAVFGALAAIFALVLLVGFIRTGKFK